jgi:hypothetical protein
MIQQHPITPPPELVKQWAQYQGFESPEVLWRQIATQAARWGSNQELEACCKWLPKLPPWSADDLRRHRRPKPPSLKELAQAELDRLIALIPTEGAMAMAEPIRRALEKLDD